MKLDADQFWRDGVAVLQQVVLASDIDAIVALVEPLLHDGSKPRPGARRVLAREPRLREFVDAGPIRELMTALGGSGARPIRTLVFDKRPEANWLVPWHQDPTIAVRDRTDTTGFVNWNVKDGEVHCQPPLDVLESIFTIRIHLDRCGEESGPLRVVRGSHRTGLLGRQQLDDVVASGHIVETITDRGGVAVMTPLSVHSSPKATNPVHRRRVLHLECTAMELPNGLAWAEA